MLRATPFSHLITSCSDEVRCCVKPVMLMRHVSLQEIKALNTRLIDL
jgi:hypothetical protein